MGGSLATERANVTARENQIRPLPSILRKENEALFRLRNAGASDAGVRPPPTTMNAAASALRDLIMAAYEAELGTAKLVVEKNASHAIGESHHESVARTVAYAFRAGVFPFEIKRDRLSDATAIVRALSPFNPGVADVPSPKLAEKMAREILRALGEKEKRISDLSFHAPALRLRTRAPAKA